MKRSAKQPGSEHCAVFARRLKDYTSRIVGLEQLMPSVRSIFAQVAILLGASVSLSAAPEESVDDSAYKQEVIQWRDQAEARLRNDNGWLTLAGRFPMKAGDNRFGTAPDNDIVFPWGTAPAHIGTFTIRDGKVVLHVADGIEMTADGKPVKSKEMLTDAQSPKRDLVSLGRLSMHIIERSSRYFLRLFDNESEMRKSFAGRVWYDVKTPYRVSAKFVPYQPAKKIPIVNVLGDVEEQPSPGYVEFALNGQTYRLDAVEEDDQLFFIFRDRTSGQTTYPPGRFLLASKPRNGMVEIDFNKAYNPPCAFSEFTTCPLPPRQNHLKVRVEAGEKYRSKSEG
jgi:uncharacterized protein (DUF1684 family)